MRRIVTLILVGAVGALAALAIADALHPDATSEPAVAQETTTKPKPPTLVETLRGESVSGIVLYSDQDCVLRSLVLPFMVDEAVRGDYGAGTFHLCRFSDPGGRLVAGHAVASPGGGSFAYCRRGHVSVVSSTSGERRKRFAGCAPAWDRDGRLTYAEGGAIHAGGRVLYSQAELQGIARHHPNVARMRAGVPYRVSVLALAWLDRLRLAMSLRVHIAGVEPQDFVALLDGSRLIALDGLLAGPVTSLVASPAGTYVAEGNGTILSRQGRIYPLLEAVPPAKRVAFSPDDGWLAVATGTSIFLVGTPARNLGQVVRLRIPAQDLVWEPGGPVVDLSRKPG